MDNHHHSHAHTHSPAFKAAAKMPVLDHYHPGQPFDFMRSDVAEWLLAQPEIRQEMFNWMKRLKAILYVDGRWIGADTYRELNGV
jgi:hypothetical protein